MRNDIILANIGILLYMMILCYFSFRNYKKEKKILYCLVAIYGLLSIVLSIINISFVLYYNSQDDDEYFKNHPNLEILQNVNWYIFIIPLFLFFLIIFVQGNYQNYQTNYQHVYGYRYRYRDRLFDGLFDVLFVLFKLLTPY
jgi:ABC-type multidrug transport system fused ATPase/permease subunit